MVRTPRERVRRRCRRPASMTSRCWPSRARGARDPARLADGSLPPRIHCCERTVAGVPMLVCGTGYTGEDGAELLLDPARRRRLGRAAGGRRRRRPASARATRCAWRSVSTSTATISARSAARSRPAWAGAAGSRPGSSAPRRSPRRAPPGRPEARRVRDRGIGDRPPGQLGARRRRRHQRDLLAVPASAGSGWPTWQLSAPSPAPSSRSTSAAPPARRGRPKAHLRQGALSPGRSSYPDDLLYHPEHDWARITARRPRSGSPGTPRTRSARSSSSTADGRDR